MKLNKIIVFLTALAAISFMVGCSEEEPSGSSSSLNRVSFEGKTMRFGLESGQTASKTFQVFTNNVTGEDRVFQIVVDNAVLIENGDPIADPDYYTVPATVTVPANSNKGEFVVNATNFNLGSGKSFILKFKGTDQADTGNALQIDIKEICASNVTTVSLDITLDDYGSETSYELYDAAMNLIASGGPYADNQDQAVKSVEFCLAPGDYTFVILDGFGDGMCCSSGNGSYILKKIGEERNTLIVSGGTFGQFEATPFTID